MKKLWENNLHGEISELTAMLNNSIGIDKELYPYDIEGSIAHIKSLNKANIVSTDEAEMIVSALSLIRTEIDEGKLIIDENAEDIHSFVENILIERVGEVGKKLHTARSRNDQVALDFRMYLKDKTHIIHSLLFDMIDVIIKISLENKTAILPGYTHLKRAQAITYSHELLSFANMFLRDMERLRDGYKRIDVCPIGSAALSGTTYNIDRQYEAELLGFKKVSENSIDSVSDRDFAIEFMSNISILSMHMSRLAEQMIIFNTQEFDFISIDDKFTTGSSIMPQKKNPDTLELIRGKTGKIYGGLISLLTTMKGLPLAYNKDMQEDKEVVFDAVKNITICIKVLTEIINTIKINEDNMRKALDEGFVNATDLADYLVKKGIKFRDAYNITANIVHTCIEKNTTLDKLPLDEYKKFVDVIENDIYDEINVRHCIEKRVSYGSTSFESVKTQIKNIEKELNEIKNWLG